MGRSWLVLSMPNLEDEMPVPGPEQRDEAVNEHRPGAASATPSAHRVVTMKVGGETRSTRLPPEQAAEWDNVIARHKEMERQIKTRTDLTQKQKDAVIKGSIIRTAARKRRIAGMLNRQEAALREKDALARKPWGQMAWKQRYDTLDRDGQKKWNEAVKKHELERARLASSGIDEAERPAGAQALNMKHEVRIREIWEKNPVPTRASEYREEYQEANPGVNMDEILVHHALPQVLHREYPELFSWHEINTTENYRGIFKKDNNEIHLSRIRQRWDKLLKDPEPLTREKAFALRDEIDREFGKYFVPNLWK